MSFDFAVKTLVSAVLCVIAVYDIRYRRIPNSLVALVFITGAIRMFVREDYLSCAIGIVFPSAVLFVVRFLDSKSIGFGDIKIVMAIGFFYGYLRAGIIVVLSLALLYIFAWIKRKRRAEVSSVCFGPFLAAASLVGFL